MIEVKWEKKKPSRKAIKEITALAEQHRAELLEQWEEIQQGN